MKNKNFKRNKEFFNFIYHTLTEKLEFSIQESEYLDETKEMDERVPEFWGDFFEQVLGRKRSEVLTSTYERLSSFLRAGLDISDPMFANILYHAELANLCGSEKLEFDEIYKPLSI